MEERKNDFRQAWELMLECNRTIGNESNLTADDWADALILWRQCREYVKQFSQLVES